MNSRLRNSLGDKAILLSGFIAGPLLSFILLRAGSAQLNLTSITLLFLLITFIFASRLQTLVVLLLAIENFLLLNFYFTPPAHSFTIKSGNDLITLLVYLLASFGFALFASSLRSANSNLKAALGKETAGEIGTDIIYLVGKWNLNLTRSSVENTDNPSDHIHLTPTEWKVLVYLAEREGTLVGQKELLKAVWGNAYEKETNYLRLFISQLRKKLETNSAKPKHILTESGSGYRFVAKRVNS
jgi:DNA-binding winged helix-turn-helix (wHTH) protein